MLDWEEKVRLFCKVCELMKSKKVPGPFTHITWWHGGIYVILMTYIEWKEVQKDWIGYCLNFYRPNVGWHKNYCGKVRTPGSVASLKNDNVHHNAPILGSWKWKRNGNFYKLTVVPTKSSKLTTHHYCRLFYLSGFSVWMLWR